MLVSIERNIDFHQDITNPKLLVLIENYSELAEGNDEYISKLTSLLFKKWSNKQFNIIHDF